MNGFDRNRHRTPSFTMTTHLGAGYKSDMERDSGFSDVSSEYLSTVELTDTEEAGRNGTGLSQDPAQQMTLMGGSYAGMSPMIIMNNFLLKQPASLAPAENQWSISSPMEVMPQSQVVLLQPMLSNSSNRAPNSGCENGRQSRSYPRIAPHPGDQASKRVGSSRLRGSSGYEQRQRKHHSHKVYSTPSPQATSQARVQQKYSLAEVDNQTHVSAAPVCDKTAPPLTGSSSVTTYAQDYQAALSDASDWDGTDTNKLKRFSNTYNILSKSGLLGITMRTKQLIKENRRTQNQLQQLQEQTTLLLRALSSGDSQLWTKLQLSLQDTESEHSPAHTPALTPALML